MRGCGGRVEEEDVDGEEEGWMAHSGKEGGKDRWKRWQLSTDVVWRLEMVDEALRDKCRG